MCVLHKLLYLIIGILKRHASQNRIWDMHDFTKSSQVGEVPLMKYREICNSDPGSLPVSGRPRERLIDKGAPALSDQELLAIILNSGIKGKNVNVLAGELLERLEYPRKVPDVADLECLSGLGFSKACTIIAMLEFGRRYWDVSKVRVKYPDDIYGVVRHYADRKQECFLSVSLNGAHEVIAVRVVTMGLVNRTMVHPREVFADPLSDRCSAICVCHNHPSGDLEPSPEDDEVTTNLEAASNILGIRFLDHIIFSEQSYYSYRKENKLKEPVRSGWYCSQDSQRPFAYCSQTAASDHFLLPI